jgi:nicotinamidase-related amidase
MWIRRAAFACLCGLSFPVLLSAAEPPRPITPLALRLQARDAEGRVTRQSLALDPAKTAVVVIDMWDRHWCQTYTARVAHLVPRMNRTLQAARQLGLQVVFAPSDVVAFYQDAPQRKAMQAVRPHPEPPTVAFDPPAPPGPTDCCECGPAQPCKAAAGKRWTRQHPDLEITERDLIGDCNNGRELLNLCQERGLDTLLYMGVASNMCVQYRSMGLRNMKRHGLRTIVVADLVEAITSNGLNAPGQKDLNFTPAGGTARVQGHLEQYVAPTIESRQLLTAAGQDTSANDRRPHVVFISAEREYESQRTLPAFAAQQLGNRYRCTFLAATGPEGTARDEVPGLEALPDADLLVLSMRRRSLPVPEMDHLERYLRAGKPLVALRTSVVALQTQRDPHPGYVVWQDFDREVLGCHYQGYNPKSRETGCDVWLAPEAAGHPVLAGVEAKFHSPAWIYRQRPLAATARVLLVGRWSNEDPDEPVAWTNTYQGGRVFYTTLGHPGDFQVPAFQRLLTNAIRWALESDAQEHQR